jgi:catechol 2,3-dioxygenase-like lactoylglutathione lyase family enzyme
LLQKTNARVCPFAEIETKVAGLGSAQIILERNKLMNMKLEVIVLPVSDIDRAKSFYDQLGFRLDADFSMNENFRVLQFTPPGSESSIIFGKGITTAVPGSNQGQLLIVEDIEAARAELVGRGAEVSEVFHDAGGVFYHAGNEGRVSGPDPKRRSYASFASFQDPDGNTWLLQEVTRRAPGRVEAPAFASVSELSSALRRAEAAHGKYEAQTGKRDSNWPDWYAQYMVREQAS